MRLKLVVPPGGPELAAAPWTSGLAASGIPGTFPAAPAPSTAEPPAKVSVPQPSVTLSAPSPGEEGEVVLGEERTLEAGEFIAFGEGPETPLGYLGKVQSSEVVNGTTIARVLPADLIDLVPDASIDLQGEPVVLDSDDTRAAARALKCSGGGGPQIALDHTLELVPELQLHWRGRTIVDSHVAARIELSASGQISSTVAGSCSITEQLTAPKNLKPITFAIPVGPVPVPVVITPRLATSLDIGIQASGQTTASLTSTLTARQGAALNDGSITRINETDADLGTDIQRSANVEGSIRIGPDLEFLLYGVAGPKVSAKLGPRLVITRGAQPWWATFYSVTASAGFAVPSLHIDHTLAQATFNLAGPHATEPDPETDPGGGDGGGGDPPTGPGPSITPTSGRVASGDFFTCAVKAGGTVACWGRNDVGQLGAATAEPIRTTPVTVAGLSGVEALAAGADHVCALLAGGTVSCWGDNWQGQLGSTSGGGTTPTPVTGLSDVLAIDAGGEHTCALMSSRQVKCWGDGSWGQLGTGNRDDTSAPVTVPGIADATSVSAGSAHTCAVVGGSVRCWGANYGGQLGQIGGTESLAPVTTPDVGGAASTVSAGSAHTCVILTDATARCWGRNNRGQLGNGSTADTSGPVTVSGLTSIARISAGVHTCATRSSGTAHCWGTNLYGSLGDGTNTASSVPVGVSGLGDGTEVSANESLSNRVTGARVCARRSSGALACWGSNALGGLGDGSTTDSNLPRAVIGFP